MAGHGGVHPLPLPRPGRGLPASWCAACTGASSRGSWPRWRGAEVGDFRGLVDRDPCQVDLVPLRRGAVASDDVSAARSRFGPAVSMSGSGSLVARRLDRERRPARHPSSMSHASPIPPAGKVKELIDAEGDRRAGPARRGAPRRMLRLQLRDVLRQRDRRRRRDADYGRRQGRRRPDERAAASPAPRSTTRTACRARGSPSTTPTRSAPAAAASPSAEPSSPEAVGAGRRLVPRAATSTLIDGPVDGPCDLGGSGDVGGQVTLPSACRARRGRTRSRAGSTTMPSASARTRLRLEGQVGHRGLASGA